MSTNLPLMYSMFGLAGPGGEGDPLCSCPTTGHKSNKDHFCKQYNQASIPMVVETVLRLRSSQYHGLTLDLQCQHLYLQGPTCVKPDSSIKHLKINSIKSQYLQNALSMSVDHVI